MTSVVWYLIIVSAGIGNRVAIVEFNSEQTCQTAMQDVKKVAWAWCVKK